MSKQHFISVMERLPHSITRTPYTYHHDYLRQHVDMFKGYSRAEIASLKLCTEDELYATALIELLLETDSITVLTSVSDIDIYHILHAIEVNKQYIERITDVPKIEPAKLRQMLEETVNDLVEMKKSHYDSSKNYGSELCAGDLIRQEQTLENRIKILQSQLDRIQYVKCINAPADNYELHNQKEYLLVKDSELMYEILVNGEKRSYLCRYFTSPYTYFTISEKDE